MENNNEQKEKNVSHTNFFKFTQNQFSVSLEKYDAVTKSTSPSMLAVTSRSVSSKSSIYKKRLNSLDSTMLEDVAYTVLDDESLKLEKKIEDVENVIKELTEKLIVAEALEDDSATKMILQRQDALRREYDNLVVSYKKQNPDINFFSIFSKIYGFPQKMKEKLKKRFRVYIRTSILFKHITPLVRSLVVRDTIGKLNKINKSVDELVNMKVPFGEQEQRYEMLINHLSRAGALHSKIAKELGS